MIKFTKQREVDYIGAECQLFDLVDVRLESKMRIGRKIQSLAFFMKESNVYSLILNHYR